MKKNILIVFDYLELGGGTRSMINIAQSLSSIYNIYFLTGVTEDSWTESLLNELKPVCKQIFTFPVDLRKSNLFTTYQIITHSSSRILEIKKDVSFEFVLLNLTRSSFAFLFINIFLKKTKAFYIFHGSIYLEMTSQYKEIDIRKWSLVSQLRFFLITHFLDLLQKFVVWKSDDVICFSKYSCALLHETYNIKEHKVHILLPPIPIFKKNLSNEISRKKFHVRDNVHVTVVASRIEPRKGIDLALRAISVFLKEQNRRSSIFYFVGPMYNFSYGMEMFALVEKLNLTANVVFLGAMKHADLNIFLGCADLLLIPSIEYETLGVVTLESLARKIPVVGYDTGATPEILKRVNQNLISKGTSPKSLSASIDWYFKRNFRQRKELGNQSQEVVAKYYNAQSFINDLNKIL